MARLVLCHERIRTALGRSPKSARVLLEVSELTNSGHIRLVNDLGPLTGEHRGKRKAGVALSELTSVRLGDWLAAVRSHGHVAARLEPIA